VDHAAQKQGQKVHDAILGCEPEPILNFNECREPECLTW
jgi:hypothetical protein